MDLENGINEETNERIINFANQIEKSSGKGFGEVIIGYQSVLVQYHKFAIILRTSG